MGIGQEERLVILNDSARRQMKILINNKNVKELEKLENKVNNDSNLLI